jgi:hypothetical protein
VAALDEPLGARAGEIRPEPRQGGVQPGAGEVVGGGGGAPLGRWQDGYQIFDRTRAFDFRITSTMARSKKLVLA